jgi:hypothetical protein
MPHIGSAIIASKIAVQTAVTNNLVIPRLSKPLNFTEPKKYIYFLIL